MTVIYSESTGLFHDPVSGLNATSSFTSESIFISKRNYASCKAESNSYLFCSTSNTTSSVHPHSQWCN